MPENNGFNENKIVENPGFQSRSIVKGDYKDVIRTLKSTLASQHIQMTAYDSALYFSIIDQCEKALERQKTEKPIIPAEDVAFRFDREA